MAEAPTIATGLTGGDLAYELFRHRAAFRLSDGRVVIADDGTQEIGYYNALGGHLSSLGLRRYGDALTTSIVRNSLLRSSFTDTGELLDTLGVFHNRVTDVQTRSIGKNSFRSPADVVFSSRAVWFANRQRLFVGMSGRYEIRAQGEDGTLHKIIRKHHTPVPVTRQD
ncbi:MAG: hypothetical protein JSW71_20995 [Gemmatimonadota bacterium]|nr:MAG: hypothetical protein JSW71_20995 [Gemmatimonadota bacterium]